MHVLVVDGYARLLLDNVEFDDVNMLKRADVVNGGWTLEVRNGYWFCGSDEVSTQIHQDPDIIVELISVPNDWKGDYNEILKRVQKEVLKQHD